MNRSAESGDGRAGSDPRGESESEDGLGSKPGSKLGSKLGSGAGPTPDLLSALTGADANRERAVAHRTRRVVMSSSGVLKEAKEDRTRARAVAVAVTVVALLLISPLVWEVTDSLVGGEPLGGPANQFSLWACIVCSTLLAAALVAGWWKRRS